MPQLHPLGVFDNAQALTAEHGPYNLVTVVRLDGAIDPERLRAGLALLTRRHPMLRARVVENRHRFFEVVDDAPSVPLYLEPRQEDATWIGVAETELARRLDLGRLPLGRSVLVAEPEAGRCELVLAFPHVLVDGTAVTHLVGELLGLLGGETEPERGAASAVPPPAADVRFPAAWRRPRRLARSALFLGRQVRDELSFRWRTRGRLPRPPDGDARCRAIPWSLTKNETDLVLRATRSERLTVNALLEAAMLLAVVRHRYRDGRLPHRYFTFPLLRLYLDPPVSDDVVRCYVTLLRLTTEVSAGDDLWELAAVIHDDIDRAMRRGDRFLAYLWSHFSMRMVFGQSRERMATTALSYTGATGLDRRIGAVEVRAIHAFVSNFALGPEYTAQARVFRGRLCFDVVYLEEDMDEEAARAIAATMRELLTSAARGRGEERPSSPW